MRYHRLNLTKVNYNVNIHSREWEVENYAAK
jgi:hypothetical protein